MSILIKEMDMPISCEKCPLCYDYLHCSIDDSLHMFLYNRHPNCPLVEIPTPHGRLIDGNKLRATLRRWTEDEWNQKASPVSWACAYEDIIDLIDDEPTILEAEE